MTAKGGDALQAEMEGTAEMEAGVASEADPQQFELTLGTMVVLTSWVRFGEQLPDFSLSSLRFEEEGPQGGELDKSIGSNFEEMCYVVRMKNKKAETVYNCVVYSMYTHTGRRVPNPVSMVCQLPWCNDGIFSYRVLSCLRFKI